MLVGERLLVDGWPGTVVAIIDEHSFSDDYPARDWAYLANGILVVDDQAGLIHYPDLDGLRIDPIDD